MKTTSSNKKTELILQTYEMLKTTSPEDIKIRGIAAACNCTSTVIYKHFDDLDHLLRFSAVRFLENYIIDIQKDINEASDSLDMLISMWNTFSHYAFENVEVFELLFFGRFKERLGDTIYEYYQLFPDQWKNMDGLFTSVFFNNDLKERNYMILHRATVNGYFSHTNDRLLNDIMCDSFYGLLLEYKEKFRTPGESEKGVAHYKEILMSLIDHYRVK